MQMNPFENMKKSEWILWIFSLITVIVSNLVTGNVNIVTLAGTVTGVTALILLARGDVWGQILTVVFSFLYAVGSFEMRYYGEMITYLGMTMPIALMSVISWLKHPYDKNRNEVKIHRLTKKQTVMMIILSALVTWLFYYILKYFNTANLAVSTFSITTSFLASYLMFYRNSYYAVAYSANDIVLIVLWIMASMKDFSYFPMVICFVMFFVNDMYGFISWKMREKKQLTKRNK